MSTIFRPLLWQLQTDLKNSFTFEKRKKTTYRQGQNLDTQGQGRNFMALRPRLKLQFLRVFLHSCNFSIHGTLIFAENRRSMNAEVAGMQKMSIQIAILTKAKAKPFQGPGLDPQGQGRNFVALRQDPKT